MKMRYGFVSNSSTTSFCIYGTNLNNLPDYDIETIQSRLSNMNSPLDIFFYCEDSHFLGRSLTEIDDDQTFGEFKAAVELETERMLAVKLDCGIHERAEANY